MKHIMVTKFNLPIAGKNNQHLSEEWLDHRFDLFEKWAYPSVKNQTVKPDKWYVFMDARTPEKYLNRIQILWEDLRFLIPIVLAGSWEEMEQHWFFTVRMGATPGLVHTTRIDSDDAICSRYCELVQENFEIGYFSCFKTGYMAYGDEAYRRDYNKNPFLTYSEWVTDVKDLKTVSHLPHPQAEPMIYICKDYPGWIQYAHDKNLFNHDTIDHEQVTFPLDDIRKDFGI